jgi:Ca-activated chloride channel family protein
MNIHFLRPEWLYALPLVIIPLLATKQAIKSSNSWKKVCDAHLLKHLLVGQTGSQSTTKSIFKHAGISFILLASIIALAGPAWDKIPQPAYKNDRAVVIALNLYQTMNIKDIKPSRLDRAKFKIFDILSNIKGGQAALLIFSEEPYVVTPLSDDIKVLKNTLGVANVEIMPSYYLSGSNPNINIGINNARTDRAIEKATELLSNAGNFTGEIIVLTDNVGQNSGDAIIAAKNAHKKGYSVSVLGIATKTGAPLPSVYGNFVTDDKGNVAVSKLSSNELQDIATAGGGIYSEISIDGDEDIRKIMDTTAQKDTIKQKIIKAQAKADTWKDMGIYLVFIPLFIAPFAFRKNWLFAILIGLSLNAASAGFNQAIAAETIWDKFWLNKEQRAEKALKTDDAETAANMFKKQDWKGVAEYKAGQYKNAVDTLSNPNLDGIENMYNLGNAYAFNGQIQEAIDEYEKVLEKDPNHEDAKHNRDLLLKLMSKNQENQSSERNKQDEDMKNQSEKDKQSSQDKHNQDNNDQNSGNNNDKNEQPDNSNNDKQKSQGQNQDKNRQQNAQNQNNQNGKDNSSANNNEEEKKDKDKQQQNQNEENDDADDNKQKASPNPVQSYEGEDTPAKTHIMTEGEQATEQMLGKIPDDPGGLLKEKLRRVYIKQRYTNRQ